METLDKENISTSYTGQ